MVVIPVSILYSVHTEEPARQIEASVAGSEGRVVAADYAPNLDRPIDGYLEDTATRNRALDVLPLFLHLDPGWVRAVVVNGGHGVDAVL